ADQLHRARAREGAPVAELAAVVASPAYDAEVRLERAAVAAAGADADRVFEPSDRRRDGSRVGRARVVDELAPTRDPPAVEAGTGVACSAGDFDRAFGPSDQGRRERW